MYANIYILSQYPEYTGSELWEVYPEARFLDVIGTKVLSEFSSLLFTVISTNGFYSLPHCQNSSETGLQCKHCKRKPKVWENYPQKSHQNCTFMNSPSGVVPCPYKVWDDRGSHLCLTWSCCLLTSRAQDQGQVYDPTDSPFSPHKKYSQTIPLKLLMATVARCVVPSQ
jgi:hypothetical protein